MPILGMELGSELNAARTRDPSAPQDPIRDFLMTEDNEWDVRGGRFHFVGRQEACVQGMRIRGGMFLGECFADTSIGVDYLGQILIHGPDPLVVRGLIGAELIETPDVTSVVGAQLVRDDEDNSRRASIEFSADTIYSEQPAVSAVVLPKGL